MHDTCFLGGLSWGSCFCHFGLLSRDPSLVVLGIPGQPGSSLLAHLSIPAVWACGMITGTPPRGVFEEYGPYAHIYSPDLFTASAGHSCDCVPPRSFGSKLGARKKSAARSRSPLVIVLLASLACLLRLLPQWRRCSTVSSSCCCYRCYCKTADVGIDRCITDTTSAWCDLSKT